MNSWSERLGDLVGREAGVDLAQCRAVDAREALETVAREMKLSGPQDVLDAAHGPASASVVERVLLLLLVHETFFYRYAAQLAVLEEQVLPSLLASAPRTLRLWSAGCSSGPEAYTLAMIALRARDRAGIRCNVEVVGTDLSSRALDAARRGVYPASTVADLPQPLRDRYLEPVDGAHFRVVSELAGAVRFQKRNLRSHPPAGRFHVIACRSALMYLRPDAARQAVVHLAAALESEGVLAVGHGESLRRFGDLLTPAPGTSVNLYRRGAQVHKRGETQPGPVTSAKRGPAGIRLEARKGGARDAQSRKTVRKIILTGVYDAATTPRSLETLRDELSQALDGRTTVEVDVDGATSLDGTTAKMIARAVRASSGRIVVKAQRPAIRRWAERHGLPLP